MGVVLILKEDCDNTTIAIDYKKEEVIKWVIVIAIVVVIASIKVNSTSKVKVLNDYSLAN